MARLVNAADAMDSWRAEGERRAETLRQSLEDVKTHANDLTGQVNTQNRAAAQGVRSRNQHSSIAAGAAKPSQEQRIAVPQQDIDPAESAVLNAEEFLQDVRAPKPLSSSLLPILTTRGQNHLLRVCNVSACLADALECA